MSDNGIVWEEPPAVPGAYTDYRAIELQLRENPGRWARVLTGLTTQGTAASRSDRMKKRGLEAVTRKTPDGTWSLWARFPEAAE